MRVAEKLSTGRTSQHSRRCGDSGCNEATREGKPFCSKHVTRNDYATHVLQEIADREAEDAAVLKPRTPLSAYNLRGITAQSIIQSLREHGPRTKARLCRELNVERALVDAYARALIRAKIIRLGHTSRGNEVLELLTL